MIHTPGPWHACYDDAHYVETRIVATLYDADEDAATARLIAAAPDLLAALQAFMADYDAGQYYINGYSYEKARAAIAKVIGE